MLHYLRKLPSFNTVGPNATSSVLIPRGPTYRSVVLKYGTNTVGGANETNFKAEIKKIRLKINGVTRFEVSGKYAIDIMNKYYGIAFNDGFVVIPLMRPWLRTIEGEENLGWGTSNVDTFELQVDVHENADAPTLEAHAWVTPEQRPLGTIVEVHELIYSTAVSGQFEISSLPKGNGDLVALHFDNSDITKLEAFINQVAFIDGDIDILQDGYQWTGLRSPQTDYRHLDPCFNNRIADVWPLARVEDFRIKLTLAQAGSVPIIMETLNTPLGVAA